MQYFVVNNDVDNNSLISHKETAVYGRTDMRSSKYSHTTNHNCKAMAYLVPVATSVNTRLTTIIIHVNITAAIQCAHTRTRLNCLTGTSVQCSVAKKNRQASRLAIGRK